MLGGIRRALIDSKSEVTFSTSAQNLFLKLREETQNFGPALKRTLNLRQQKLGQVEFTPIGAVFTS